MPIMLTRKTSPARFGMVAAVMGKGGGHKRVAKKGLKRAHIERRVASGLELDTSELRRCVPVQLYSRVRYSYLSGTIPYYGTTLLLVLLVPVLPVLYNRYYWYYWFYWYCTDTY